MTTSNRHTLSKFRAKQKVMILEKIREVGDATCNELEHLLHLTHQSASARISELSKANRIVDSGLRRLTDSKCPARVYKINEVET